MSSPKAQQDAVTADSSEAAVSLRERVNGYYELTKPRLSFMSVLTAIIGYLAADPSRDLIVLSSLIIGTSLAAGGAAVLNQWLEREADAKMERTKDRPIPSGQIIPYNALMFGLGLSIFGSYFLYAGANPLSGLLTALTVASYVLLYTPLKKLTTWNTLIGAIPGALPPLIGWAAAEGSISTLGWILFVVLFLWQMPHFFAIAWTYRKDYQVGGFIMLSNADENGAAVALQSFVFAIALVISTLLPTILGYTSLGFGAVAFITGYYILRPAWLFLIAEDRDASARRLFITSIFYLPALLIPLVLDLWLI
ncbi:MAG: heme o synthase [Puniceicoccaceae bacterium]|nr:heme o synthase [Puniceicoccaceae bacterium]